MDFIDYVGKWELTMMLSALTIWLTTLNPPLGFLFGLLSNTIAFKV